MDGSIYPAINCNHQYDHRRCISVCPTITICDDDREQGSEIALNRLVRILHYCFGHVGQKEQTKQTR